MLKIVGKPLRDVFYRIKVRGKTKIFCIGLNKTGTTSVKKALEDLGVIVANEGRAKELFQFWKNRNFGPIIKFCSNAQAFQDSPFSFPYTYILLDQAFPNSKFILTVRDDAEQWYQSITRFHSKLWGENGLPPTKEQLQNAFNTYKGRPWEVNRALFNTPENNPYSKAELLEFYRRHRANVEDYFHTRSDDLLIVNLSDPSSYKEFTKFLNLDSSFHRFPWVNKT